jgi:hypothetical protein
MHFRLCGSWYGKRRGAAEFLGSETLRYGLFMHEQEKRLARAKTAIDIRLSSPSEPAGLDLANRTVPELLRSRR